MRALLYISSLVSISFSVYAANMNFYSCQNSSLRVAQINQQCVSHAGVILQNNESGEVAKVACADTTTAVQINRIQQCLYNAMAVMDGSSVERKEIAASIACSGDSVGGSRLQQCLLNAKTVLKGASSALSDVVAALACSGSTEVVSVQSCLNQALSVLTVDITNNAEVYLAAASACSGSQNSSVVQSCLNHGGQKIETDSRMDLIRKLILK